MNSGLAILYAVAAVAAVVGVALLARLGLADLGGPARAAHRIGGVMALMLGLFLAAFATVAWQAGAATLSTRSVPE